MKFSILAAVLSAPLLVSAQVYPPWSARGNFKGGSGSSSGSTGSDSPGSDGPGSSGSSGTSPGSGSSGSSGSGSSGSSGSGSSGSSGSGGGDSPDSESASPFSTLAGPAPLPTAGPNERIIAVGEGGSLSFNPSSVTAPSGTVIRFLFQQPAGFLHSISESSFDEPCSPLSGGFNSGLQGPGMEFNLTITDETRSIWFYCQTTQPLKHCGLGMVGGINAPTSGTNIFDAFHASALSIGFGEVPQTATAVALTGVAAAATAPAASRVVATPASPTSTISNGAENIMVSTGSLISTLFLVALLG